MLLRAKKKKKALYRVTIMEMWADLLALGVNQDKITCQPNAVLLELWWQLNLNSNPGVGINLLPKVLGRALKDFLKPQDSLLTLYG